MPETDPILIRIQAVDQATQVINRVATSLKKLDVKVPKMDLGKGVAQYEKITTILPKTASSMQRLADPVKEFQKQMSVLEVQPVENLSANLKEAGITQKMFTGYLSKNNMVVMQGVGVYDKLTGAVISQGQAVKLATIQSRRFKFEYLSVMFAGMALSRAFGGLLKKQMELYGVTQLMSDAWTIVLGPVMDLIIPVIYMLLDAFMELSPEMQMIIGIFVLLGAALGAIMMLVGQSVLAIMGFAMILGTTFSGGVLAVGALMAVFAGLALIVTGVVMIVKGKLEGIGLIIMGIGAILILFIGWWALIPIAVGAAVYLIIKYWDNIKAWFSKFFGWIGKAFSAVWEGIKNAFKAAINFIIGIANFWIKGWEVMINFAIKGINALIRLIDKIPGIRIRTIGKVNLGRIPYLQKGGIMPYTGLAYLHAGERVTPAGNTNSIVFSPTINLNAEVSSDYDVRRLADQLNKYWADEFQRALKGRAR